MNKPLKVLTVLALTASLTVTTLGSASAQSNKVMWGKTELKVGQLGKVTVLKDTPLYSIVDGSTLTSKRTLKKGEEFRVYQYKNQNGELYGVGGSGFIMKDSKVKYETPSKSKLLLISNNTGKYNLDKLYPLPKNSMKHSIGNIRATWHISEDSKTLGKSLGFQDVYESGATLFDNDSDRNPWITVNKNSSAEHAVKIQVETFPYSYNADSNKIPHALKELSIFYGIPEISDLIMDYKIGKDISKESKKIKVGNREFEFWKVNNQSESIVIMVGKPNVSYDKNWKKK